MEILTLGLGERHVDYREAWEFQRTVHAEVAAGTRPDTLILVEHQSVYTAGKRTATRDRPADGTAVVDVDRGGRITWHGPGQLVGYPIIKLAHPIDVLKYVRALEQATMDLLDTYGLKTVRVDDRSGVWLPANANQRERKVCAIGVRVAKGVTMHGFALNCNPDMDEFGRIVPCGLDDADVASLSHELGRDVAISEVTAPLVGFLEIALADIRWSTSIPDGAARSAAPAKEGA